MPITVNITGTSIGTDAGPFAIYHTAVDPSSQLASGVTRPQLVTGLTFSNIPDGTNDFYVVSSGICGNTGTANLTVPTNAPTAAPTPSPTPSPTAAPTAAPTTPAPATPAPVTPAPVTPAPTTPAPVTPEPTAAPVTPAPVTPAPVTPAPTTAPTAAPVTPAPVTPEPTASPTTAPNPAPTYAAPVTSPVTPSPTPTPTASPVVSFYYYTANVCHTGENITVRSSVAMSTSSVYDLDATGYCATITGTTGGPGYDIDANPELIGAGGCANGQCIQATPAPITPAPQAAATYRVWEVCAGANFGQQWYADEYFGYGTKGYVNQDTGQCAYSIDQGLTLAAVQSTYPSAQALYNGFTNNNCACE